MTVSKSATLKARAFLAGWTPSSVKAAGYTVQVQVATPQFSPGGGTFTGSVAVTVTCATSGATIHYTTNGADPTESDQTVASGGTVKVDHSLTLKARAFKAGWTPSAVKTSSYTINSVCEMIYIPYMSLCFGGFCIQDQPFPEAFDHPLRSVRLQMSMSTDGELCFEHRYRDASLLESSRQEREDDELRWDRLG